MPRSMSTGKIVRPKALAVSPTMNKEQDHDPVNREKLFAILLPRIHQHDAALVQNLIFAGNRALHHAALAATHETLGIDVILPGSPDIPLGSVEKKNKDKLERIMNQPGLAGHVRTLVFRHPSASVHHSYTTPDPSVRESERMQAWILAAVLLSRCKGVETFDWQLAYGVQGEVWTALASMEHMRNLKISYPPLNNYPSIIQSEVSFPRVSPELQALPPTSDTPLYASAGSDNRSWTLGKGWNNLATLKLAGLSQNGAKTLATQLQILAAIPAQEGHTRLVSLDLSTHFLDNGLLSSIGQYGSLGSLKHLALATTGTRLTADTLQGVMEGCIALESFVLNDGEGRLDKTTWSQIDTWPTNLRSFTIEIDESAPHHSWVLHHLASIHHLPFSQFDTFQVKRLVHPTALLPFPPVNASVPKIQRGHEPEAVPPQLLEAILGGEEMKMRVLCLDWWEMGPNELDGLVKGCTGLSKLRVGITFPIVKLVTMMQPTFASVCEMEEMVFTSLPRYNLDNAPTKPKHDTIGDDLPPLLAEKAREPDPAIPDNKDLRKFVRRMPKLRTMKWTGRGGKGEWHFTKKTTLVNVHFTSSIYSTLNTWWQSQLEGPFLNYEEPGSTSRTLLELAPSVPIMIASSPVAEFPSLSRSSTSSSFRLPTPSSPIISKSFSLKDVAGRLDSLAIMPEEEGDFPSLRPKTQHRRSTTTESTGTGSGSISSNVNLNANANAAAVKRTPDLSKSTKRLSIGHTSSSSTSTTKPVAPQMLKTTSAPARSNDVVIGKIVSPKGGEKDKGGKGRRNSRQMK